MSDRPVTRSRHGARLADRRLLSKEQVQWLPPATGTDLLQEPIASRKTMNLRP